MSNFWGSSGQFDLRNHQAAYGFASGIASSFRGTDGAESALNRHKRLGQTHVLAHRAADGEPDHPALRQTADHVAPA